MPKIKELTNKKLNDYLDAYNQELQFDKNNQEYKEKIVQIKKALAIREKNGFDLKESFLSKLFSKFKK